MFPEKFGQPELIKSAILDFSELVYAVIKDQRVDLVILVFLVKCVILGHMPEFTFIFGNLILEAIYQGVCFTLKEVEQLHLFILDDQFAFGIRDRRVKIKIYPIIYIICIWIR